MLKKCSNPDIELQIKYPKIILSACGLWPVEKSSWMFRLRFLLATSFTFSFSASMFLNVFFSLNDLATAIDSLYFLTCNFAFIIKLIIFSKKMNIYNVFLQELDNPHFIRTLPEHENYTTKWISKSHFNCKLFIYFAFLSFVLFSLFPLFDEDTILPCLGWFPYEVKSSAILYVLSYIFQVIGIGLMASLNLSIDLLPPVFMHIGCAQVEILKYNLANAVELSSKGTGKEDTKKYNNEENAISDNYFEMLTQEEENVLMSILRRCVKHHDAINRIFFRIQTIFNPAMLVLFIFSVMTLCMTAFKIVTSPLFSVNFFNYASFFTTIIIEMAFYTINGHYVITETRNITDSCYEMEWYRCSTKVRKMLMIIMERSKRPNVITAGGVFELSINNLTFILRTSYSYFTVLTHMNSEL